MSLRKGASGEPSTESVLLFSIQIQITWWYEFEPCGALPHGVVAGAEVAGAVVVTIVVAGAVVVTIVVAGPVVDAGPLAAVGEVEGTVGGSVGAGLGAVTGCTIVGLVVSPLPEQPTIDTPTAATTTMRLRRRTASSLRLPRRRRPPSPGPGGR